MDSIRNNQWLRISGVAYLITALLILVLPLKWVVAAVLAAAWHELCHIAALLLTGGSVKRFSIGYSGAVLRAENLEWIQSMICILAGPIGGILPVFLARWFPRFAVCTLTYSLYNLLPVYPLDGGRVLRCLQSTFRLPESACVLCEHCVLGAIVCICLYETFVLKLGLIPVMMAVAIVLKTKSVKTLAN